MVTMHWTPVDEKLPELDAEDCSEPLLLSCRDLENGTEFVASGSFQKYSAHHFNYEAFIWRLDALDEEYQLEEGRVIAYMPFPEPYKKEE